MELYKRTKRGFTLVELMIAMTIFIVFTGILINSYTSIVRSQHQANEYRILYSEARSVFDGITDELRNGMVDYCEPLAPDSLNLISKDGLSKTKVQYLPLEEKVQMTRINLSAPVDLNSDEVKVKDFKVYVTPNFDPYNQENFQYANTRFHPKVTIYALFEKQGSLGKDLSVDFQTTISSRIYNQITDCSSL